MDLEKRGTTGCIKLIKHEIGRRIVRKKDKVFAFFIDLKAAFDKMDRKISILSKAVRDFEEEGY